MRYEPGIRLAVFITTFLLLATGEALSPRRARAVARRGRWPTNVTSVALNTLLTRMVLPLTAVGVAVIAEQRGWGLLHAVGPIPAVLAVAIAVLMLDFAIYLQHILFHVAPILWRVHRVHHADIDVDVTTGSRFHPVEILLSMLIKFASISALGAPPMAVLLFEVLLNAGSLFNHANLRLLPWLDRVLRLVVVTPDMHRVHHSAWRVETNTNFGFTFPWWDHLCRTYRAQPAAGHAAMTVGLPCFRDPKYLRLDQTLLQPLFDGNANQSSLSDRPQTMRQGITIFLLIVVALILLPLIAFASPPDPSWIAGIYDGADGDDDDIVILVYETAATNTAAPAKIGLLPCLPGISLERILHGSPGARFTRGPRSPPGSVFYLVRSCVQLLVGLHAHCIRLGSSSYSYPRVNHQVPPVAMAISTSSTATKSCDHLAIGTLQQFAQRERTPLGISRRWVPRRTTRTASAFGGISIHLSNRLLP